MRQYCKYIALILSAWLCITGVVFAQSVAFPGPGLGAIGTPTLSFQTSTQNASVGSSSVSFTSQAFGSADPTRVVIVCATGTAGGAASLSSATIGGVSATIQVQTNGAARGLSAIISAAVPTGTTGTVSLTYNTSVSRIAIGVWSAINMGLPAAATATNGATTTTSSQTQAMPVNVLAGGFAIGCSYDNGDSGAPTSSWTGPTQRYLQNAAGDGNSGADISVLGAVTPQTMTETWVTSSRGAGSSAAFR